MIWKSRSAFWLLSCVLCLPAAGCNSSKLPATVPVQGKVTYRGQPLTTGTIGFSPVKFGAGLPTRPAVSKLSPDGTYRLSSFRPNDGVMPGEYRVTVESYSNGPTENNPKQPLVSRIPERYRDADTSGLSFTIPPDARGPLVYDIDLK